MKILTTLGVCGGQQLLLSPLRAPGGLQHDSPREGRSRECRCKERKKRKRDSPSPDQFPPGFLSLSPGAGHGEGQVGTEERSSPTETGGCALLASASRFGQGAALPSALGISPPRSSSPRASPYLFHSVHLRSAERAGWNLHPAASSQRPHVLAPASTLEKGHVAQRPHYHRPKLLLPFPGEEGAGARGGERERRARGSVARGLW